MKKRISLFLALLMMFSVLFVTTASAVDQTQSKNEAPQENVLAALPREGNEAPRATDPDVPTVSVALTLGTGDETTACSHKYKVDKYNNGKHWLVCSKCGKTITKAHTYGSYTYVASSKHKRSCTVCNYTQTASCSKKYWAIDTYQHKYYCKTCGHVFSKSNHSMKYEYTGSDITHIRCCKYCNYYYTEKHKWKKVSLLEYKCEKCKGFYYIPLE